jgi:hypothetical protein
MLFMSSEVIQQKNTVQPTFSHFWPLTPSLTNAVKRPDNFEFSEKFCAVMREEEKY